MRKNQNFLFTYEKNERSITCIDIYTYRCISKGKGKLKKGFEMKPIVEMRNIVKRFPGVLANDHVNFDLFLGEAHALVGENGAGKSTLMKILYGQQRPEEGEILIDGKKCSYDITGARQLKIGMVHQNFMQIPDFSILENIILGNTPCKGIAIDYKGAEKEVTKYLKQFGMNVSPSTKIKNLSVGERQKIEIIKALFFDARILILDEPTAVLIPQESDELFGIIEQLKAEGRSIVFISHKLREVIKVGDRITVMRKGRVTNSNLLRGNVTETDVAQAMIGKQNVDLIANNDKNSESKQTIFTAKNLWYFNEQGIAKLRDMSLSVKAGEILGIGGVEGNGQTELIRTLIGLHTPCHGEITLEGVDLTSATVAERRDAGMGYVSEDRMTEGLVLNGTIEDNVIAGVESNPEFSNHLVLKNSAISAYCNKLIKQYDIMGLTPGKYVKMLSGGNMQKIVLAREIERKPKVLIAAQPTRGLDIGAINAVRELLLAERDKGLAIILISADLEELMSLSDRMIIMYEGHVSGEITDILHTTEAEIGLLMGGAN